MVCQWLHSLQLCIQANITYCSIRHFTRQSLYIGIQFSKSTTATHSSLCFHFPGRCHWCWTTTIMSNHPRLRLWWILCQTTLCQNVHSIPWCLWHWSWVWWRFRTGQSGGSCQRNMDWKHVSMILYRDLTMCSMYVNRWNAPMLRIFLVTSRKHQIIELVVGILCTVASVAAVLFGKRFFKKTFKID